uniref:Uncharacterized protein n=1 Tax=Anguilla anguilla TaxID=7936 RepID=A0A0E9VV25_ANGAN
MGGSCDIFTLPPPNNLLRVHIECIAKLAASCQSEYCSCVYFPVFS